MKNSFGRFSEETLAQFAEEYSFRTCQRSDGSYYGTGGQCRKGTETTKPEKEEKKGGGGGKADSFAMTEKNFDDKKFLEKFSSMDVNDPAAKEFMAAVNNHEGKLQEAQDSIVATKEKAEAAEDKAEARLNKINAIDDKARKLEDQWGEELDKDSPSWEKIDALTKKQGSLDAKVDADLSKEFPDYADAKKSADKALDVYKEKTKNIENVDDREKTKEYKDFRAKEDARRELRQEKLGGDGYNEIRERASEKVYGKSKKGISEYTDSETGQGAQETYKGGLKKYESDLKDVSVKAIETMQRKYPDFLPGVDAKQFVGSIGVTDGSGGMRVQSDEMFYGSSNKTGLVSAIQSSTVGSAFGADAGNAKTMGGRFSGWNDSLLGNAGY